MFNTWLLWWNAHTVPFTSRWWNPPVFHPMRGALALSEHLAGLGVITTPVQLAGASVVTAYNVAFILSFGEVGTSILVAPPGESTLPLRVFTLTANAPPGHVAVLALFQSLIVLVPLILLAAVSRSRRAA